MSATTTAKNRVLRAAIYVRISLDRGGQGLGVQRQEQACREKVAERGWEVADVYVDNNVSATSKKVRPAWQQLVEDLEAGRIDAIVVWDMDRLTRMVRELEDVIDLLDRYGVQLATCTGQVDLSTPGGRLVARMLGSVARHEAEHKGERQRAMWQQQAEMGKPHMGGSRPFGYLDDRVRTNPIEAEHVRDAARRVLAGESLRSVAQDWNEQGIATTRGKQWTGTTVRQMLASARISGRREIKGKGANGKQLGTIVKDECWEAIISPEDSDRLRSMFTSSARRAHSNGTRAKHLLTGLLVCSRCDSKMNALNWEAGSKFLYRCPAPGTRDGAPSCGRLSVLAKYAEPTVVGELLQAMDSNDFKKRLAKREQVDPDLAEKISKDQERLRYLATQNFEGELDDDEWKTQRDLVKARLELNKAKLARSTDTVALHALDGDGNISDRWAALTVPQQRAILREVFTAWKVLPVERRGQCWDAKRLEPQYRF